MVSAILSVTIGTMQDNKNIISLLASLQDPKNVFGLGLICVTVKCWVISERRENKLAKGGDSRVSSFYLIFPALFWKQGLAVGKLFEECLPSSSLSPE